MKFASRSDSSHACTAANVSEFNVVPSAAVIATVTSRSLLIEPYSVAFSFVPVAVALVDIEKLVLVGAGDDNTVAANPTLAPPAAVPVPPVQPVNVAPDLPVYETGPSRLRCSTARSTETPKGSLTSSQ